MVDAVDRCAEPWCGRSLKHPTSNHPAIEAAEIAVLAAEAELPAAVVPHHHTSERELFGTWAYGQRWAPYEVSTLSTPVRVVLPDSARRQLYNQCPEGSFVALEPWLVRVRFEHHRQPFVEWKRDAQDGSAMPRFDLCDLSGNEPEDLVLAVLRGRALARRLLWQPRLVSPGRKKGRILDEVPNEFLACFMALFRELGRRPTQQEMARELSVGDKTVRRYLRDHHLPWPPA